MKRPNQEWCEPHLEYIRKLEAYVDYLESVTTKPENLEGCSHDRKTDNNNGKPNDTLPRTKNPINIEDIGLTEEDAWEFEQDFLKCVDELAKIDDE